MIRHLYSACYSLLLPLIALRLLWRSRREPEYRRRWRERLGLFPAPGLSQPTWIHAVSVGELASIAPLLELLLVRQDCQLVVTTTTPGASRLARARYGGRIFHAYLPLDLPWCVNNFLTRVQPARLLLVEKELWPNLVHLASARACPVSLVNARMSSRSRDRYLRLRWLALPMMQRLQWVAAQTDEDADNLLALGVPRQRIRVCGNLKYDVQLNDELRSRAQALRRDWNPDRRPVVLVGSLHPEEYELVLQALWQVLDGGPDILLLLVPRHPEQAPRLMQLAALADCEPELWSPGRVPARACRCVVVDTLGDMLLLFGVARLAVMGGSFAGQGGHNLAEAAAWALPVVSGPSLENVIHTRDMLLGAGALRVVNTAAELTGLVLEWLQDESGCDRSGQLGYAALGRARGASAKTLDLLGLTGIG